MSDRDPATLAFPYYRDADMFGKLLAWGRPYICPFDPLVAWVKPDNKVFDIGCGTGLWLLTLAATHKTNDGIGCDTNAKALNVARRAAARFSEESTQLSTDFKFLETSDISKWPSTKFDVVSLIDVLHHIPASHQLPFLLEAWDRVKPGGRLIYKDMASKPQLFAMANILHDLVLARQLICYYPIEQVSSNLEQYGGRTIHRQNWRRGLYAHELVVVER